MQSQRPCGLFAQSVHAHDGAGIGGEEERVSHKPHDKWEDKGNSVTLRNDVTKKDEELK